MPQIEISLHKNQFIIYNDAHRFKWVSAGRRFGKSLIASRALCVKAIEKPNGMFFLVAPVVAQTTIIWRMVLSFLPKSAIRQIFAGTKTIVLKNGSMICAKSGDNPDTLRGEGLDGCILDEAAMLRPEVWSEAIRPALSDKLGWCWAISTPAGKNWFYREYLKGLYEDASHPDYKSFTFTSYDNPFLLKSEVDAMAEEMPELAFQQEILARFIEGGGTVFRDFTGCIRDGTLRDYERGKFYVAGVDLGRHKDFTVIFVLESQTHETVYYERFNQTDWNFIEARIESVYNAYGGPVTYIDSTGGGDPIYERLFEKGINIFGINLNQSTKPALIRGLSIAFDRRIIFIPDIEEVKTELAAYTFTTTALNTVKYGAPLGFHDDTVIALALANYGLNGSNPNIIGMPTPSDDSASEYDNMSNIVESWDDCVLDLGDPYGISVIPELDK